jgi:hypothetical protein
MAKRKWVFYKDKLHTVIKDYGNGYAEIQEVNTTKVELIETKYLVPHKGINKEDVH